MYVETIPKSFLEIVREYAASEKLTLPVFPEVALELHKLMADPDVPVDRIAKVILTDQSLATQLMKLANSGFYAGLRKTSTITEAILRLGVNNVFNHVVALKQGAYYRAEDPTLNAYLQVLFMHALCTAGGSQWLIGELGHSAMKDHAYLGGLMHDIGKLLILKVIDTLISKYPNIKFTPAFIHDAIVSLHSNIGCTLLTTWNINEIYQQVVKDHHTYARYAGNMLLLVISVCNQSCVQLGVNTLHERTSAVLCLREAKVLNIEENTVNQLNKVIEEITLNGIHARL